MAKNLDKQQIKKMAKEINLQTEKRNTFGLQGAGVFLKIFSVPLLFAKKPPLMVCVSRTDLFRWGDPSKERPPKGGGAKTNGPPKVRK